MEFRARVIKGVLVPNEPNQLPEGREVVLSLVEVSDEPALKSEFETILDQMETTYDELGELLSQRRVGTPDVALEAQITAKKEELTRLKKQRTQRIEDTLKSHRSAADVWEESLAEAKRYVKELNEAPSNDTTP